MSKLLRKYLLLLIISQPKPFFPSVLSFDRFLAIRSPMIYKKWITKKRASVVVVSILVATGLMGVLPVLTEQHQYSTSHQCLYATLYPRSFVLGVSSYFIVAIVITAPLYIQVSCSKLHDIIILLCQKQASRAGTSNYTPQYPWDVIVGHCPEYPILA